MRTVRRYTLASVHTMKNNTNFLGFLLFTVLFSNLLFAQAPSFTSSPVTAINEGDTYSYVITTDDPNDDNVSISGVSIPEWLDLITDSGGDVTTLAGTGSSGYVNGSGTNASFNLPTGIVLDVFGNVFIADQFNHIIRKINPDGDVTTLAGSGSAGSADGNGVNASFNQPVGVAIDASGNIYVADQSNHKIRKINPDGDVTTLAGSGSSGNAEGNGTTATFNGPTGIAVDASGNVYVGDQGNHKIRMITVNGDVTTLAGSGSSGSVDANGIAASFNQPVGVAADALGNVFVADFISNKIRKIAPNGDVSTIAGSGIEGSDDGNGSSASFNRPSFISVDSKGIIYASDRDNNNIRMITSNGDVTTLAGSGSTGSADGNGADASFNQPTGVALDASGNVYVADQFNNKIRKISGASIQLTGNTTDNVGSHPVVLEANDGNGGVSQQSFTVVVSAVLAIDDELQLDDMIVFSKGSTLNVRINYQLIDATVSIYNLSGSLIKHVDKVDFIEEDWSTTFNKRGLFIIAVESRNRLLVKKFVR